MAATNINRVVLTGNLTRDPELRSTSSGMSVCSLRVACNTRRKDQTTGDWVDKPNYLRRDGLGRPGRELRALPRQGPPGGDRRPPRVARVAGQGRQQRASRSTSSPTPCSSSAAATTPGGGGNGFTPRSDVPADTSDFAPAGAPAAGGARPAAPATTTFPSRPGRSSSLRYPVRRPSPMRGAAAELL